MEYALKDKLQITKEFLIDLEMKSWQEIEHLQSQIANIEATEGNLELIKLLKNLLTSYYVFTGGLENLNSDYATNFTDKVCADKELTSVNAEKAIEDEVYHDIPYEDEIFEPIAAEKHGEVNEPIEPFEYFVDFDEPVGDPISDEDLYGN